MKSHSPSNDDSPAHSQPIAIIHVSEKLNGATLAGALKDYLGNRKDASWNQIKRWIARRHIEVNGNLCMDEARRLRTGDVVKFWRDSRPKPIDTSDIRIAYLDPHLVIVEKPAGVTTLRHVAERKLSTRRRQLQPTLDELLPPVLAKFQRMAWPPRTNGPKRRSPALPPELSVFPVHRLDRDTSGLMVFARTRDVEQKLIAKFRKHTVDREYVGVCHGSIQPQTIRSELVRDRGGGLRGSLPKNPTPEQLASAQTAITHVLGAKPIADGRYSLFRCKLETGRTHQIRIHLSEAGHRLCGEPMYVFDVDGQRLSDDSGAPRQALHSDRLAFHHPISDEPLKFEMPWPRDLAAWVRALM